MGLRYGSRDWVYVTVKAPITGAIYNYIFPTSIGKQSIRNDLGQKTITDANLQDTGFVKNSIIGTNNFKPPRAKLLTGEGTTSSFYSHDKAPTLINNGWNLSKVYYRPPSTYNTLSVSVIATVNSINYCWPLAKNRTQGETEVANVEELILNFGLEKYKGTEFAITGATFPKPPIGYLGQSVGSGNDTGIISVSSFIPLTVSNDIPEAVANKLLRVDQSKARYTSSDLASIIF